LNSEQIDPETLAAFLDGTLPASERERLLRVFAQGGAAYEDLIEAQALQAAELGVANQAPPASSPPIASLPDTPPEDTKWWRRRTTWGLAPFLAAAGIAAAVLLQREDGSPPPSTMVATVQVVSSAGAGAANLDSAFGAGWNEPDWSTVRGPRESLEDRVRGFRLGVRFVDFDLALSSNDTAAQRTTTRLLSSLAESAEMGTDVARRVEALASDPAKRPTRADLAIVADDLRTLVNEPEWFDVAVWSETARLFARTHQTAFFAADAAPMRELRRILPVFDETQPNGAQGDTDLVQPLRGLVKRRVMTAAEVRSIMPILDSTVARGGRHRR
jgi:hypothetical protein